LPTEIIAICSRRISFSKQNLLPSTPIIGIHHEGERFISVETYPQYHNRKSGEGIACLWKMGTGLLSVDESHNPLMDSHHHTSRGV
jgi:hypothetical protein